MNGEAEEWMPVAMLPEKFDMVEVRLADGSVRTASWLGARWWTPQGGINPVSWRPRKSLPAELAQ